MSDASRLGEVVVADDVAVLTYEGPGPTIPMFRYKLDDGRVLTVVLPRALAEQVSAGLSRMLRGTQ